MAWLHRHECKGLQRYILHTNRLREIQGGSQLIEQTRELLEKALSLGDFKATIESAAAGAANVLFPTEESAQAFQEAWPMILARHAPGLQVVQGLVDDENDDALLELWRQLEADRSRLVAPLPEATPLAFRSPRTGLPGVARRCVAETETPEGKEKQREWVDATVARKLDAFEAIDSNRTTDGMERLFELEREFRFVSDLDRLEASYVGVVHADGNQLGELFRGLDRDARKALSDALQQVTVNAARQSLSWLRGWMADEGIPLGPPRLQRGRRRDLPLRPVVLGGDDLTVILRGDLALPFASKYLRTFRELSQQSREIKEIQKDRDGASGLDACAGVVLVHSGHPFYRAHDLAEELCKFAKKSLRHAAGGRTPSGLAFHRVTNSLTDDYDDLRKNELGAELAPSSSSDSGPRYRFLTAGPYTLESVPGFHELDRLDELVEKLDSEHVPLGPLRQAIDLMLSAPDQARDELRRHDQVQRERGGLAERDWEAVKQVLQGMNCSWPDVFETFDEGQRTPLLDALNWRRARATGVKEA
ncbi:MAG: hypothetical protein AAF533_23390 [Acidobacteriota bacterium]